MEKEKESFKVFDIFPENDSVYESLGIESERNEELLKIVNHAFVDAESVTELIQKVSENVNSLQELAYVVYVASSKHTLANLKGKVQSAMKDFPGFPGLPGFPK